MNWATVPRSRRSCAPSTRACLIMWPSKPSTKAASLASAAFCRSASKPPTGEPGALEPTPDRRHAPHVPPDEVVAMVGGLQQDRPLVDAEIVLRDPAVLRVDSTGVHLHPAVGEARVEGVLEAVAV